MRSLVGRSAGRLKLVEYLTERKMLSVRRYSELIKIDHNGSTFHVQVSFFDDGSVGEVFINCSKEGSEFKEIMNCMAMMISLALQHGAGLFSVVKIFGQYHEDELPRKIAKVFELHLPPFCGAVSPNGTRCFSTDLGTNRRCIKHGGNFNPHCPPPRG